MEKKDFIFTLILAGVSEITAALEDALFEAGCDDAMVFSKNRIIYLDFIREANNLQNAVHSAISDVETAGFKIARVEPADLVTAAEIARRLNKSREYIRLLMVGERGKGNFPVPLAGVTAKTSIWSWAEVVNWLYQEKKIEDYGLVRHAEFIWSINRTIDIRNHSNRGKIKHEVG